MMQAKTLQEDANDGNANRRFTATMKKTIGEMKNLKDVGLMISAAAPQYMLCFLFNII